MGSLFFNNRLLISSKFCSKFTTFFLLMLFQALIDSTSVEHSLDHESGVRMVALFDHEEVGSNSAQGAGSPAMLDALSRITASFNTSNIKVLTNFLHTSKSVIICHLVFMKLLFDSLTMWSNEQYGKYSQN
jgi:aspartyl aminopeptidase